MPMEPKYRNELYQNYVSVQTPDWLEGGSREFAVWAGGVLKHLRGWLPADKSAKCLDLGCGSGRFLQTLRAAGYCNIHGVDLGPQAIEIARSKGLDVTHADFREYLHNSPGRFDLITAFDVIEHFAKDELLDVLRLFRDHLKPGGRLILQTPNALSPWGLSYRYHDLTHEWIFDPHCLIAALALAGFAQQQVREVPPYVHGFKSGVRWLLWKLIWGGCAVWNLAETGSTQGGIYTRNLLCISFRQDDDPR